MSCFISLWHLALSPQQHPICDRFINDSTTGPRTPHIYQSREPLYSAHHNATTPRTHRLALAQDDARNSWSQVPVFLPLPSASPISRSVGCASRDAGSYPPGDNHESNRARVSFFRPRDHGTAFFFALAVQLKPTRGVSIFITMRLAAVSRRRWPVMHNAPAAGGDDDACIRRYYPSALSRGVPFARPR